MAPNLRALPLKTLLVLRAVCKSFLSVIDDPYLVSLRLRCIPENSLENRFLLYQGCSKGAIFQVHEIHNLYTPRTRKRFKIIDSVEKPGFPKMNPPAGCWNLVCSLNGLVLLSTTRHYTNRIHTAAALWNPSIKKHRQLSRPSPEARNFGLGYDPLSKDYKLVALQGSQDQAWVYSVKTKSWTEVLDRRFRGGESFSYSESLSFKDGVMWIEKTPPRRRRLVWFDFGTERFRYADEMHFPDDPMVTHQQLMMLDGGSTIGVWWVDERDQVFVWALESQTTSWTLRYKLAPPHCRVAKYCNSKLREVVAVDRSRLDEENGELVWKYWVEDGKTFKVVTYKMDVGTQVYHKKDIATVQGCLDIYIESLVMAN